GAGPGELCLPGGVEQAPVRPNAAFGALPGLIDALDDVVVDAIGLCSRDKIADDHGLLCSAGIGVVEVIAGTRPAEFGDHDPLARIHAAQIVVESDGAVDRG